MENYIVLGIITFITVLFVSYTIYAYNTLVKRRNRVNTQWAQIDVQLTRRADLIPNLMGTVKGYAAHEKEIFENVAAAKNALACAPSPGDAIAANDQLSKGLSRLFAVAEAYPDLKADSSFVNMQVALKETEDKIAYARQFYNDTVLLYRDKLCQFPSSMIAKIFGFQDADYYDVREEKRGEVEINF